MNSLRSDRVGVLIVGHGERGSNRRDNAGLRSVGANVGAALASSDPVVDVAVLNGAPALADAIASLESAGCVRLVVYPFFMSDGFFTRKRLPQALDDLCQVPWRSLVPLGLEPGLPQLIERRALACAERELFDTREARLLIVAHGSSKSPASALATEAIATAIRGPQAFGLVETAFLEEAPYLSDKLKSPFANTIVIGAFTGDGLHASEDIETALSGLPHKYLGAIGTWPEVSALVTDQIKRVIGV